MNAQRLMVACIGGEGGVKAAVARLYKPGIAATLVLGGGALIWGFGNTVKKQTSDATDVIARLRLDRLDPSASSPGTRAQGEVPAPTWNDGAYPQRASVQRSRCRQGCSLTMLQLALRRCAAYSFWQ